MTNSPLLIAHLAALHLADLRRARRTAQRAARVDARSGPRRPA